jgi:hypothetical protein
MKASLVLFLFTLTNATCIRDDPCQDIGCTYPTLPICETECSRRCIQVHPEERRNTYQCRPNLLTRGRQCYRDVDCNPGGTFNPFYDLDSCKEVAEGETDKYCVGSRISPCDGSSSKPQCLKGSAIRVVSSETRAVVITFVILSYAV